MKRTALSILCLLLALPLFAGTAKTSRPPLTAVHCVSLEHVTSGWRMEIKCQEGSGTIVVADTPGPNDYRGSGMFEGWSQEAMNALNQSLVPSEDRQFGVMQLG